MNNLDLIREIIAQLESAQDDKPQMHKLAKLLAEQAKVLAHKTQPGLGEFKWTAKTRNQLSNHYNSTHVSLTVATSADDEVWHGDGHYMVLGTPSARFEPLQFQDLPFERLVDVLKCYNGGEDVTVTGAYTGEGTVIDAVNCSNGAIINRVLLSYVSAAFPGYRLTGKGPLQAVCIHNSIGKLVGLVMPLNIKR